MKDTKDKYKRGGAVADKGGADEVDRLERKRGGRVNKKAAGGKVEAGRTGGGKGGGGGKMTPSSPMSSAGNMKAPSFVKR